MCEERCERFTSFQDEALSRPRGARIQSSAPDRQRGVELKPETPTGEPLKALLVAVPGTFGPPLAYVDVWEALSIFV